MPLTTNKYKYHEKYPKVAVVLLNYKTLNHTVECLESLERATYPNMDIIVVDNDSGKNEAKILEKIARRLSKQTYVLRTKKNLGFSGGTNVGIKFALKHLSPKYILLLNNDTIVSRGFLEPLVDFLEKHPDAGAVTGKIYYYDFDGKNNVFWSAGGEINWITAGRYHYGHNKEDKGQLNKVRKVGFISCCYCLVRSEVFNKVGLLPEEYFFGVEEMEFSLMVRRAGYSLYYVPSSVIWHKVGKSHKRYSPMFIYNSYRNNLLFIDRNLSYPLNYIWEFFYTLYLKFALPVRLSRMAKDPNITPKIVLGLINSIISAHRRFKKVYYWELLGASKMRQR